MSVKHTSASNKALDIAKDYGLRLTSSYRSPEHNKKVGGSPTSYHTRGQAYDFAGSAAQMDKFANWAKKSGLFVEVLWKVKGHYDHVHVAWKDDGGSSSASDMPAIGGIMPIALVALVAVVLID